MATSKIEFAVQMTCDSCVEAIRKSLQNVDGIKSVDIDLKTGSVVVDSSLAISDVQNKLESTGKRVVVKGQAGTLAAVSILEACRSNNNIQGVVRFMQPRPDVCIIDGTVDGLKPGAHHISIHECGDLSKGCDSVGEVFNPQSSETGRVYGDLGTINAANNGRATFRLEDNTVKITDVIGRSLVVTEPTEDSGKGQKVTAGIIARSAGLFQNPKTICACDGVTIWDEVSKAKSTL